MAQSELDEPLLEQFEIGEPGLTFLHDEQGAQGRRRRVRSRSSSAFHWHPRALAAVLCVLVGAVASTLTYAYTASRQRECLWESEEPMAAVVATETQVQGQKEVLPWEEKMVLGEPTVSFRDNLRNDTKYITAWLDSGWTNDVQSQGNLIYLAKITNRIPVLPPFVASSAHMNGSTAPMSFGTIFDVPRLSRGAQIPILEWHDVKVLPEREDMGAVEPLGCWSVWETMFPEGGSPRLAQSPADLGLDVSYTRVPDSVRLGEDEVTTTFWKLTPITYPDGRAAAMSSPPHESAKLKQVLSPDEQMTCFDYLYFVGIDGPFEYYHEYSPGWKDVLKHAHWTEHMDIIVDASVRKLLELPADAPIPLFITMHVRHGDFAALCEPGTPQDECFAPLSRWAAGVEVVRKELRETRGVDVSRVLVTSDETDEAWWTDVAALGWTRVDHEKLGTEAKYGQWYPIFIDAVIQSRGKGFVGTMSSTMSLLAMRRVQDWNDGVGKMIPRESQ